MKIPPVGVELFGADEWTDGQNMPKPILAYRNLANTPFKKYRRTDKMNSELPSSF
jgi:hypothetical protein